MECITPFYKLDEKIGIEYLFPCGRCPPCVKRRVSQWSFRLLQQSKISNSAIFLTLTYDTENVPISKNGYMTLCFKDVQKFLKRLRKSQIKDGIEDKVKYYLCGEYGGITLRPHYHLIIFNAQIKHIEKTWQLGQTHYGNVEGASIGYTLKYMSKLSRIPMHKNDDRTPERALMSKGLGANYMTPKMINWHKADLKNRMYVNAEENIKIGMPRYYKDKIYNEDERDIISEYMQEKTEIDKFHVEREQINKLGKHEYYRLKEEARILEFRKVEKIEKLRNKI